MLKKIKKYFARIIHYNKVNLYWWNSQNWGDALNPYLVELISKKEARYVGGKDRHKYMVIGSILNMADKMTTVWGAGFIRQDDSFENGQAPGRVCAVRGPLTRNRLLELGVECPEVYGDPALLLPQFYQPKIEKEYELGIIPHYTDKESDKLDSYKSLGHVNIIDVEGGVFSFVDEVNSCKNIVSSSLHGIICADSYNIPSGWIKLDEKLLGDDFKFRDYHRSIGVPKVSYVSISESHGVDDLIRNTFLSPMDIDLSGLLESCPF